MKRVQIHVDGSPRSLEAVRAAVREGPAAIERIELVNVQPLFHRHISRWVPRATRDAWRAERSAHELETARRIVAQSGIPFEVRTEAAFMARKGAAGRLAIPAGLGFVALMILAEEL